MKGVKPASLRPAHLTGSHVLPHVAAAHRRLVGQKRAVGGVHANAVVGRELPAAVGGDRVDSEEEKGDDG